MENNERTLLVVDDEAAEIEFQFKCLEKHGWKVEMESDDKQALSKIGQLSPDVIMLDLHFPDDVNYIGEATTGWKLQKEILSKHPNIAVVLLTKTIDDGQHTFQNQPPAHAIYPKSRLKELFNKENGEELLAQDLSNVFEDAIAEATSRAKPKDYKELLGFVVGKTPAMVSLAECIINTAKTELNVLIEGENGTGKGMAAKAIHNNSPRIKAPFVVVECTTIPKDLLESTLFGHEKGAFTGATERKLGKFELADKGTIFLDEIGDILPELQVKLLRAIQEKQFERVGSIKTITADVRIIAATNRNLDRAVKNGEFRVDLYYRLQTAHFIIPPLRERLDDLYELCKALLPGICSKLKKDNKILRPEAYSKLCRYGWPGNIRELENVLNKSVMLSNSQFIFAGDVILPEEDKIITMPVADFSPNIPTQVSAGDADMIKHYLEKVDMLSAGKRYVVVKELPKQMKKDFLDALDKFLKQQLGRKAQNKDFAEYLCGVSDVKTCATVRQFLRTNGFYIRGPLQPAE